MAPRLKGLKWNKWHWMWVGLLKSAYCNYSVTWHELNSLPRWTGYKLLIDSVKHLKLRLLTSNIRYILVTEQYSVCHKLVCSWLLVLFWDWVMTDASLNPNGRITKDLPKLPVVFKWKFPLNLWRSKLRTSLIWVPVDSSHAGAWKSLASHK